MKKVTVMIPTYNQSQYIKNTIDSVLSQNYTNLEIIVSDDSTNFDTKDIIESNFAYELKNNKLFYFHNKLSLGRVQNYHKTLYENATGEYVINLDGDDWLTDNEYILESVVILDENPNVMATMAKKKTFYEDINLYENSKNFGNLSNIVKGNDYIWQTILGNVEFNHLTVVYRREIALQNNFYTLDDTASDADSIFRLIAEYDIALVDKFVGVWRVHYKNATFVERKKEKFKDLFVFEENVYKYLSLKFNKTSPYKLWMKMWKLQTVIHYFIFLFKCKDNDLLRFLMYILLYEKKLLLFLPKYIYYKKII